jgi:hypothetical protein
MTATARTPEWGPGGQDTTLRGFNPAVPPRPSQNAGKPLPPGSFLSISKSPRHPAQQDQCYGEEGAAHRGTDRVSEDEHGKD